MCLQSLRFFNVDIKVKEVFCFPLLFCLCEGKNFGGSSTKLAASQTGTNICRRNQLLSSVWTLNSLKWNIVFTEPFFIAVTVSKLLIITWVWMKFCSTRPKPPYRRQSLAGSCNNDTVRRVHLQCSQRLASRLRHGTPTGLL